MERAESRRMPSEQRGRFKQKAPAFRHDVIGHTAACTAAGSSSDQPERALRFLARLDRHLLTLADQAARRDFLDRQLEGWQRRYARFIATEGESEPVLIHAGLGINPEQTVRTFTQLKKDADDLFKAIADVEAALNQAETIQRGAAERDRAERATQHDRLRLRPC